MGKLCEGKVSVEEVSEVLKTFEDNKVPGNDGLPAEFYKTFWHLLGESLVASFNTDFEAGNMSTSQRQAIITLIDKKDKDRSLLDNWRPISVVDPGGGSGGSGPPLSDLTLTTLRLKFLHQQFRIFNNYPAKSRGILSDT